MLTINLYKWTAIFCCVYLVFALNPFVLWLTWPPFLNIPIYIIVLLCSLALLGKNKLEFSRERVFLSVLVFLFAFHINLPITSGYSDYGRAFSFVVLIVIVFFPKEILARTLRYFIRFHVFICVASVIVFFLTAFVDLPHIQITNTTTILKDTDYYYRLYGVIVSSTNTVYNIGGLSIGRICGIYPEPGHFATYISFIIIAQRILSEKIHKIFFVAGALTFSPVFYFTLVLLMGYNILVKKNAKSIRNYFFYMALLFITALLLGDAFKEQIWELAIGRNLTGGLESRLDERANEIALGAYRAFVSTPDIWVGKGANFVDGLGILSDFRGFIFKYGVLGLVLSLFIILFLVTRFESFSCMFLLFPVAFLIYFQRSWMFGSIYVYMLCFILLVYYRYVEEQKTLQIYKND